MVVRVQEVVKWNAYAVSKKAEKTGGDFNINVETRVRYRTGSGQSFCLLVLISLDGIYL
jgi:hypothetical protein